jgi:hypothetical protein
MSDGLRQLQFFAAFAPNEVPPWFEAPLATAAPPMPKSWDEYDKKKFGREELYVLKRWHHGELIDSVVPEDLQWYVSDWNKYREEEKQFRKSQIAHRFFAWRWYYARQMCLLQPNEGCTVTEFPPKEFFTNSKNNTADGKD